MRRLNFPLLASILLITGSLLLPSAAFAHATPVLYSPQASQLLKKAPERVRILFSERVEDGASSITVFAPNGSKAAAGPARPDTEDPHILSVDINNSGSGTYAISWQVVSADDGHFTKGAYLFSVGTVTEQDPSLGQFQIEHRNNWAEGVSIWIELLGQAMLLGLLALLALVRRPVARAVWFGVVGAGLVLAGSAIYILLQSATLAANQGTDVSAAARAFLGTVTGGYAGYRFLLGAAALATLVCFRRSIGAGQRFGAGEWALVVLALLMALLRARVSHAAASSFWPWISVFINFVHLAAKAMWVGGLLAFLTLVIPGTTQWRDVLRLSRMLLGSFFIGGLTGVYIIWLHLKDFGNMFSTHWGMRFAVLTAFAALLLLLRLYQQLGVLPAAARIAGKKEKKEDRIAVRPLGALLLMEAVLGMAVLYSSSFLIITTPPLGEHKPYAHSAVSQGARVTLSEYRADQERWLITVDGGAPVRNMVVTLTNEGEKIGPIVEPLRQEFVGGYSFPVRDLFPFGSWKIDITAQREEGYDATASFTITYPDQVTAYHDDQNKPRVDVFDLLMIVAAIIILLAAVLLWRQLTVVRRRLAPAAASVADEAHVRTRQILLIVPLELFTLIALGLSLNAGHGGFAKECTEAGGYWHESVPMRDGRVTSPISRMGCMLGMGRGTTHITDERELSFYLRKASSLAALALEPAQPRAGTPTMLTFTLMGMDGKPVTDLSPNHDRYLHVIAIHEDLRTFAHVHPDDARPVTPDMLADAKFPMRFTFPKPGKYLVAVDYAIRSQSFMEDFVIEVQGEWQAPPAPPSVERTQTFDGYTVTLDADQLRAREYSTLTFTVSKDGRPVTDLEPYLSAPMHVAIVKADLNQFAHVHGELGRARNPYAVHSHIPLPARFGPAINAYIGFPSAGTYVVFGQFKHQGKVVLITYAVEVQ